MSAFGLISRTSEESRMMCRSRNGPLVNRCRESVIHLLMAWEAAALNSLSGGGLLAS